MFYVKNPLENDWHVVLERTGDFYNMSKKDSEKEDDVISAHDESYNIREDKKVIHGIGVKFLKFSLTVA